MSGQDDRETEAANPSKISDTLRTVAALDGTDSYMCNGRIDNIIWLIIMIPVSLLFTGIGIYAWKREKPMWFWSGSTVKESEIADIAAYNRANGFMWIGFSLVMWISTILGVMNMKTGGIFLMAGCIIGVPVLPIVYGRIYRKYKK